eukprot:TRINITY_DN12491_c0_g1_i2.p1 TRINITY_DN12491_c0_g1~~TRINITY_DN12491_c0_g1_i2.p1  ORF type:complete len:108 (+),score=27.54 TRINITY_DN12491_c0_g1_i2:20-343(+)
MFVFFFQAEDGIRDFCLSRGLGDVYKRQLAMQQQQQQMSAFSELQRNLKEISKNQGGVTNIKQNETGEEQQKQITIQSVSYTHLTLPTKRIVQIYVVTSSQLNKRRK